MNVSVKCSKKQREVNNYVCATAMATSERKTYYDCGAR